MPPDEEALAQAEARVWVNGFDADALAHYQGLCREREMVIAAAGDDRRHGFIVTIPVADRPLHLQACLESLLQLCRLYAYGGQQDGRYTRLRVLIADDSAQAQNIERHREIAADFGELGLVIEYFGLEAQRALLERLSVGLRERLAPVFGEAAKQAPGPHKGASIMRNLAYLRLRELGERDDRLLCWFLDSDQEFRVQIPLAGGAQAVYAINYFHHLDRIFSGSDALMLTGKVVGDPPVSPAVMAGNFLEDVLAFLGSMSRREPRSACGFHPEQARQAEDAAYHDMADLFGFRGKSDAFDYPCDIAGPHDHAACLADFAAKLDRFFDGEHPTRKSYYRFQSATESMQPARTVYTGNYVLRPEALGWFIPFAPLKLRMAGPVLGRLVRGVLGGRFISANLPMLHRRTVEALGESEFRAGIARGQQQVDLSLEFERQFFGDLMLFSAERLVARGYPEKVDADLIGRALIDTEAELLQRYAAKHEQILASLDELRALFEDRAQWWWRDDLQTAQEAIARFIDNMRHNFGEQAQGYRMIHSAEHRQARIAAIRQALIDYPTDRATWKDALTNM